MSWTGKLAQMPTMTSRAAITCTIRRRRAGTTQRASAPRISRTLTRPSPTSWRATKGRKTVNVMANQHHLELLRQGGANTWNAWRRAHPAVLPDLRSADLNGADLVGYNLSLTNLWEANLHGANLREADLIQANLVGANLANANLSGASLIEARLEFSDLRGANLVGADLSGADLHGANLLGADLQDANLNWVGLTNALVSEEQLRTVKSRQERLL